MATAITCAAFSQSNASTGWLKLKDLRSHGQRQINNDEDEEEEGEDDKYKGMSFGLNLGTYFASKKTANFYNGSLGASLLDQENGVRAYTIAERLTYPMISYADRNYILTLPRAGVPQTASDFSLPYDTYPTNMRYTPAFYVGFQMKYNFNRDNALVFNINGVKLKAADLFTIQFYGTTPVQNGNGDIRTFTIVGKEQRLNMNLGYRTGVEMSDNVNWYFQGGGSMLMTQVQKNQIVIGDRTYDLFMGFNGQGVQSTNYQPRSGVGFGYYLSTGLEFYFNDKYGLDIGLGFSHDKMKMIDYTQKGWNKWLNVGFNI